MDALPVSPEAPRLPRRGSWTQPVNSAKRFRYVRIVKTENEHFWVSELRVLH